MKYPGVSIQVLIWRLSSEQWSSALPSIQVQAVLCCLLCDLGWMWGTNSYLFNALMNANIYVSVLPRASANTPEIWLAGKRSYLH